MYDSDEVRDVVRRDASAFYAQYSARRAFGEPVPSLPPAEQRAIDDMLSAWGNPWQRVLRVHLDRLDAAERQRYEDWLARMRVAATRFVRQIVEMVREIGEALRQLGEAIIDGIADGLSDITEACFGPTTSPPRFRWQRRPRRPDVRPAHLVDPVAAGRHPVAIFRTRIRGGRR